jgi:glycosyltransferase involved in cell wall biosynthesis
MKICHVVPIYLPGILPGCSKYIQDMAEVLSTRGHEVTILTANAITGRGWVDPLFGKYSFSGEETLNGIRIKRLPTRWPATASATIAQKAFGRLFPKRTGYFFSLHSAGPHLSNLKKDFYEERYEVIHVTPFPFALIWLVRQACHALRRPFVCSPLIHFEDSRHENPLLWTALKDASFVIACSNYEKERMVEKGIIPSRIHVIPMGIILPHWENVDAERFRERYGLKGKKIILFAGTKNYNKGSLHLLQAAEKLGRKREDFVLVGMGLATGEWEKKKAFLPKNLLLDMGYVSEQEKREAFEACDLFAMPSRYDSFGIVYLEAWQCAKPVIGARVGAIPEIIEEGRDGLLVEFGNVSQLASVMDDLLDDPDRCRIMGERGRKKVIQKFDWHKNIELMEKVYRGAGAAW